MIVHVELHRSPAAGEAERIESADLSATDAMVLITTTLFDQLNAANEEDEFTANLFVVEKGGE